METRWDGRDRPPGGLVSVVLRALAYERGAAGVADPLREARPLAAVWADLARLLGEPLPADVRAALSGDDDG